MFFKPSTSVFSKVLQSANYILVVVLGGGEEEVRKGGEEEVDTFDSVGPSGFSSSSTWSFVVSRGRRTR